MNPNKPFYPQIHLGNGGSGISEPQNGISIRDYIAIEAMKAIITKSPLSIFEKGDLKSCEGVVNGAYDYADALIAESNKK